MSQFYFDALLIAGTLLLALFGVLFAIEKYHKNSWYLFVAASICLIGAAAISYFRNSSTPPEKKDSLTIKADTSKIQSQRRLTKPNIPPYREIPMLQLVCSNCGAIRLFDAVKLGLM